VIAEEEVKSEPVVKKKMSALATPNSQKILDQLLDMNFNDVDDDDNDGSFMTKSSSTRSASPSKQSKLLEDLLYVSPVNDSIAEDYSNAPVSNTVAEDLQALDSNTNYNVIDDVKEGNSEGALTINPITSNSIDDTSNNGDTV